MKTKRLLCPVVAAIGIALVMAVSTSGTLAGQATGEAIRIDSDDIGGMVTGPKGPEAGVWVIAETTGLPTKFVKIVVTDDRGRYVVPDLPKANYTLWARGYGLVDGPKVTSKHGKQINLTATVAPNDAAAAKYYPAIYWYSMLHVPPASDFDGKHPGIGKDLTQSDWLNTMKNNGCVGCHQLGQLGTRTIPEMFGTGEMAWVRRVQSGQAGSLMFGPLTELGSRSFKELGDWTDRIKKG